ncbi:MAG TPA: hypothetical protein ACHBX0_10360 [Arsenophonus sp.]
MSTVRKGDFAVTTTIVQGPRVPGHAIQGRWVVPVDKLPFHFLWECRTSPSLAVR